MTMKVIKSKYGIEVKEDTTTGRLFMYLDGLCIFTDGIPKDYARMVERSFNELAEIRKKTHGEQKQ